MIRASKGNNDGRKYKTLHSSYEGLSKIANNYIVVLLIR